MSVGTLQPPDIEEALWAARDNDETGVARHRLIECYSPFARMLVARIYAKRTLDDVSFEDHLHFGMIGLIESIDRFDVTRGIPFEAFAVRRIKGAVYNGISKCSELREQLSFRAQIRRERLQSIVRKDADGTPDLFGDMVDIVINLALGYFLEDSDIHGAADIAVRDRMLETESLRQLGEQVRAIVDRLPERERVVIQYHYYHQLAFNEIADVLGLTRGRVSQIHKRALGQVRESLASLTSVDEQY